MPGFKLWTSTVPVAFAILFLSATTAGASQINFTGKLKFIDVDVGGGAYSGVPVDTDFSGFIDHVIADGSITDGVTPTDFGCCIAAGGLSIENNVKLRASDAALINNILGSAMYSKGDVVDLVDVEGDVATGSGGRIEIGLSFLFHKNTFKNGKLSNFPFNPYDASAGVFFIVEEDAIGTEIYSAIGRLDDPVSIPGVWFTYDDFNDKSVYGCKNCINPDRWTGLQRFGFNQTETIREKKSNRLRLAHRSWGNSDSDAGTVQQRTRARFRDSVYFSGVCVVPRVKKYEINDCPANGSTGRVRMRYVGTYFDADDGMDDGEIGTVYGWFDMIRSGDSPDKKGVFRIQGYASECQDADCQTDNWSTYDGTDDPDLYFGTVKASKNNKAMCIEYDRVAHQLLFSFGNDVRVVNTALHGLPAFEADMMDRNDWHVIETRTDVENCSTDRVTGFIDGDFDNAEIIKHR